MELTSKRPNARCANGTAPSMSPSRSLAVAFSMRAVWFCALLDALAADLSEPLDLVFAILVCGYCGVLVYVVGIIGMKRGSGRGQDKKVSRQGKCRGSAE